MADAEASKRGTRKERQGVVVSKSGNKTVVVLVERRKRHAQYGKVVTQFNKFHAHDEDNAAKVGDKVLITEARPLSRMKRWRLVKIVVVGKSVEEVATV